MTWNLPGKKTMKIVILALGVFGLVYLLFFSPFGGRSIDGKRVYSARSIRLKYAKGDVMIRARDGHIAYEGQVKKGVASGKGVLYRVDGSKLYEGEFASSKYEGMGTLFYENGVVQYEGAFNNNQFDGKGALYNDQGILVYQGEFKGGLKQGVGVLYDESGSRLYKGSFMQDMPVYQWFLGKNGAEIVSAYEGDMVPEEINGTWLVRMPKLSMSYSGTLSEDTEGGVPANIIYVNQNAFVYGNKRLFTIPELTKVLGEPMTSGEYTPSEVERRACEAFEPEGDVYATVYFKDDVTYTFFSVMGQEDFFMIEMQGL